MERVNVFYLVDEDEYNSKFKDKPQLTEKLELLSSRVEKKVRKLLEYLQFTGLTWNRYGIVSGAIPEIPTSFGIYDFVVYAATGEGSEPLGFIEFLRYMVKVEAPLELFCKKIQKSIQKLEEYAKPKKVKRQKIEEEEVTFNFI